MADWGSINGQRIVSARVSVPYYGKWVADVLVATDTPLSADATLVLGDLTLVGKAFRQNAYAGSWSARITGGRGWSQPVPPQAYSSPVGVTRSLVLSDVAALVGESVIVGSDAILGTVFVRERGPASRLLRGVAGSLWYVDPKGVTQVGVPRDASAIASDFQVTAADPGKGSYTIATETLSDWMPGRTFTSSTVPQVVTIGSVSHVVGNSGQHRVEVLSADVLAPSASSQPTPFDRTARALRAIIAQEAPLFLYGSWEYVVQSATEGAVDAVPMDDEDETLPEITNCPILPSVLGERVTLAPGSTCVVQFLNGNRGRPVVTGGDYSTPPTLAKLAGGGPAVVRVNDKVNAGYLVLTSGATVAAYFAGTPAGHALAIAAAAALSPPGSVLPLDDGRTTTGSTMLQAGG